ncbi:granzyme H-like, partial [Equus przewalskii]|uniref:Granzyme H-like n=1 Tax=Equus przewalskii TaxID=9798 RepID=A0ABM4LYP6_EQUPR
HSEKVILLQAEPGRTLPWCLQGTVDPTLNHHLPEPSLLTTATPRKHIFQSFLSEDIIGGQEAMPHSYPYMALAHFVEEENEGKCGSVLMRKDFVLMAAHSWGSSINMTLGAHNIQEQERTQQVIPVREAIYHPHYNPNNLFNDIMLLKLEKEAKLTAAVGPFSLPMGKTQVKPRNVFSVASWRKVSMGILATTLQEVKLTVQKDEVCDSCFPGYYSRATQICVGDAKKMKSVSEVMFPAST